SHLGISPGFGIALPDQSSTVDLEVWDTFLQDDALRRLRTNPSCVHFSEFVHPDGTIHLRADSVRCWLLKFFSSKAEDLGETFCLACVRNHATVLDARNVRRRHARVEAESLLGPAFSQPFTFYLCHANVHAL